MNSKGTEFNTYFHSLGGGKKSNHDLSVYCPNLHFYLSQAIYSVHFSVYLCFFSPTAHTSGFNLLPPCTKPLATFLTHSSPLFVLLGHQLPVEQDTLTHCCLRPHVSPPECRIKWLSFLFPIFFFLCETLPSNSCPGGIPVVQPACIHSFIHPLPTRHPSVHPSVNVTSSSVFTVTSPINPRSSQILIGQRRTGFSYCHNKQTVTQSLLRPNPPDAKQAESLQNQESQLTLTLTCWEVCITQK